MRIAVVLAIAGLIVGGCAKEDRNVERETTGAPVAAATELESAFHRPAFSPDGRRVVFMRQDQSTLGDWELYLADDDGSRVMRLTTHAGWDGYAAFAPDGKQITFDRDDGEGTKKVPMLMNIDTGEARKLGDYEGWLSINAWAPDGSVLYGFWEKDGQRDIYALNTNGEIVEQITDTPDISEHDIQVSRDGAALIFSTERVGGGGSGIDRIRLASRDRTTLVESSGRVYGVAISPDGRILAFNDDTPGGDADAELYLLDMETGERRQMTDNEHWDHMPFFHPSGAYLLFTSYRSGHEAIYRMKLEDGSVSAFDIAD